MYQEQSELTHSTSSLEAVPGKYRLFVNKADWCSFVLFVLFRLVSVNLVAAMRLLLTAILILLFLCEFLKSVTLIRSNNFVCYFL